MQKPLRFGNYLLLERIAVGGMAEVFVAKAFGVEGFERLLAIKKILPTMGEDAEFIHMFVDEARIAVQLAHANIVQVLELGKSDENLYIAMEYISGRDLRQLIDRFRRRQQGLPIPQACLIVAEVCEALDYAHRKRDAQGRPLGIVHRDVSPQNVLVSFEGEVKLIDFGIAKAESRLQKTQSGILKGKFSYMSPEQVKGQPIDGRSDVFACGVLLWELVCGEKLFTGESDFAILEKVKRGAVPEPRSRNPACPEGLQRVILRALTTEPADRYQSASELHDALVPFTMASGSVFGSRQLAAWLRKEFKGEFEKEQKRLRTWLAAGTPPHTAGTPAVIVSDLAHTPQDPMPVIAASLSEKPAKEARAGGSNGAAPPRSATPPPRRPPPRDGEELPTMKMDEAALALGQGRFDVADERTVAPRKLRGSALSRPVPAQKRRPGPRRWALYAGLPIALGVLGVSIALRLPRDPPAGKLIVTPLPSVPADLIVDGRPSGQLPPFVRTLPAGHHRVEVRADGYKPFSAAVEVGAGAQPLELTARLVSDRPLQLDGVVLSPAPAEKVRAQGLPPPARRTAAATRKAQDDGDAVVPVDRMLDPAPRVAAATPVPSPAVGYLVVKSRPAARLTIDGRDANRWTPIPAANPIVLPAGAHTLILESADGQRLEEQVRIEAGKTVQVVRTLP